MMMPETRCSSPPRGGGDAASNNAFWLVETRGWLEHGWRGGARRRPFVLELARIPRRLRVRRVGARLRICVQISGCRPPLVIGCPSFGCLGRGDRSDAECCDDSEASRVRRRVSLHAFVRLAHSWDVGKDIEIPPERIPLIGLRALYPEGRSVRGTSGCNALAEAFTRMPRSQPPGATLAPLAGSPVMSGDGADLSVHPRQKLSEVR